MKHIAAIDIGSNASRLLIKETESMSGRYVPQVRNELDYFVRTPLRLGLDVYTERVISPEKGRQLAETLLQYRQIMDRYHTAAYRACATASLRDALNGAEVARRVSLQSGVCVEIISGREAAALSRMSYFAQYPDDDESYRLFADVGGGSTDVCLCHHREELFVHSFQIGSMRMMSGRQDEAELRLLDETLRRLSEQYAPIQVIGSGGSIHKICELYFMPELPETVAVSSIQQLYDELQPLSIEERMQRYHLKRDRAEIIVAAAGIFLRMARLVHATTLRAPRIGVRDGLIASLL